MNSPISNTLAPETLAVRAGQERSQFGEHAEALYLTSSFVFENAAQAAARFSGEEEGNVYARFSNPTTSMFEARLSALEGAEDCIATASGMSAIMALCLAHVQAGEHIVAANGLFGASTQLFNNILSRCGIVTTTVDATDPDAWGAAIRPGKTRLFFLETPTNPLTQIADIAALSRIAHAQDILVAVDNSFCTPILQKPLQLGADFSVYSATKYLDEQVTVALAASGIVGGGGGRPVAGAPAETGAADGDDIALVDDINTFLGLYGGDADGGQQGAENLHRLFRWNDGDICRQQHFQGHSEIRQFRQRASGRADLQQPQYRPRR
ncbi:hypothetical protein FACS1894185_5900 [Betaproteobacteria bacterium]|nr:hypothetical protein FACS1894185_5900 [Betaproteobacteria bacterium]